MISIEDEQTGDVMNKKYAPYQKQMLAALKWLDVYKYLFFVLLDGDFRPQSGEVVKAVGGSVTTIVERQVEQHIKWAPENFTDFLSTSATRTRKSSNEEGTHVLLTMCGARHPASTASSYIRTRN